MIYAIMLDRSEVGHVLPVVDELRAMGNEVGVIGSEVNPPKINRWDTVLCVGDRLQLLRFLVNHCPTARICQLHAGETTTAAADDCRYRWAITGLATQPMTIEDVGAPCLEHAAERVAEAQRTPPLGGKDYALFAMNAWIGATDTIINECLEATARAARDLGWWVYAVQPNCECAHRINREGPNQIVQDVYGLMPEEFQRVIAGAHVMVGNSSAGIIEAPSLMTPTINIGPRQDGRPRSSSVLDVAVEDVRHMRQHIENALTLRFDVRPYDVQDHPAKLAAQMVKEVEGA
jgi:hypothetical protein